MDPPPSGLVRAVKVVLKSLASLPEASAPTSCLRYVLDQFEGAASHGPTARALDRAAAREPPPETDGAAPDVAARPVAGGVAHGDAALLATVDAAGLGEVRDAVAALEAALNPSGGAEAARATLAKQGVKTESADVAVARAALAAAPRCFDGAAQIFAPSAPSAVAPTARRYRDGEARGAVTGEFGGDAEHALATLNPRGGALGAAEALHRCAAGGGAGHGLGAGERGRLRAIAISVDVLVAGPDLEVAMEAFAHVVLYEALAAERSAESLVVALETSGVAATRGADALAAFGAATGALHRAWDDGSPRVAAAAAAEQAATAAARWRWRAAASDGRVRAGDVVVAVDGAAVPDAETCASLLDGKASAALTLRRVVDDGDGDDDAAARNARVALSAWLAAAAAALERVAGAFGVAERALDARALAVLHVRETADAMRRARRAAPTPTRGSRGRREEEEGRRLVLGRPPSAEARVAPADDGADDGAPAGVVSGAARRARDAATVAKVWAAEDAGAVVYGSRAAVAGAARRRPSTRFAAPRRDARAAAGPLAFHLALRGDSALRGGGVLPAADGDHGGLVEAQLDVVAPCALAADAKAAPATFAAAVASAAALRALLGLPRVLRAAAPPAAVAAHAAALVDGVEALAASSQAVHFAGAARYLVARLRGGDATARPGDVEAWAPTSLVVAAAAAAVAARLEDADLANGRQPNVSTKVAASRSRAVALAATRDVDDYLRALRRASEVNAHVGDPDMPTHFAVLRWGRPDDAGSPRSARRAGVSDRGLESSPTRRRGTLALPILPT
ncbi:hypothetical protein JL722_4854 [Aureococcus anophagefferens]|nr:hypothetical protein JL722_4854 [Aureococcus anophagefferens]